MKWPNSLTIFRHGQSAYNALKEAKTNNPQYQQFLQAYENRKQDSATARAIAENLLRTDGFVLGVGDYDTGITKLGEWQAQTTGKALRERGEPVPDVAFISPYRRTWQTWNHMKLGWPELNDVKEVEDERIREQEHGLSLLYNDWRIFHVMHPEQEWLFEQEGPYWYRYPQGESVPDVRERLRSITRTLINDYAEQNVYFMAHHLTKLSFRANMERLSAEEFQRLDRDDKPLNVSRTHYVGDPGQGEDGRLILAAYNQILY